MQLDSSLSLERIYPDKLNPLLDVDKECLDIHLQRYRFAGQQLAGSKVLDMACGCGYGTYLMAKEFPGKSFWGVDVCADAVAYAREAYQADNLHFICADALHWDGLDVEADVSPQLRFDTIVSLETIEHLPDPEGLIANMVSLLSERGRIIASVPVTPTCDGNPHHLHDFTRKEFLQLFSPYHFFPAEQFQQVQRWKFSGIFSKKQSVEVRSQGVGTNVLKYYRSKPAALWSRLHSIVTNGFANTYLTALFDRHQ